MEGNQAASEDPLIGKRLERYRLVRRLGAGGMGTVYAAVQEPLGRHVAVKLIHADLARDPSMTSRFLREAQIASSLTNPHTVTVFDFGQSEDGTLFLAMELLEGESLESVLRRRGALSPAIAMRIALQICRSLEEAHGKGIVHRDLKPENIYLTAAHDGSLLVKVLDYGLARLTSDGRTSGTASLTSAGMVVGTPLYMSPEQAVGRSIDARSDLYSLGVVLFQTLTGVPPFVADEAGLILAMHVREPIPAMASVTGLPPPEALESLVRQLMAKERDDRPASIGRVSELLRGCLHPQRPPAVGAQEASTRPRVRAGKRPPPAPQGPGRLAADGDSETEIDTRTLARDQEPDDDASLPLSEVITNSELTLAAQLGGERVVAEMPPSPVSLKPLAEVEWDAESSKNRTIVRPAPVSPAPPRPAGSSRLWPAALLLTLAAVGLFAMWTTTSGGRAPLLHPIGREVGPAPFAPALVPVVAAAPPAVTPTPPAVTPTPPAATEAPPAATKASPLPPIDVPPEPSAQRPPQAPRTHRRHAGHAPLARPPSQTTAHQGQSSGSSGAQPQGTGTALDLGYR
jgi:eukaryotic-like serine/threonine-protein kinase